MPLIVDYKDIPFWQEKFVVEQDGKKIEDPWVFVVGIFSMHTGITHITRENAAEFFVRCKLVEACFGALMTNGKGEDVPITSEVIDRFVGVRTNCSRYTRMQFYKHLREELTTNLTRQFNYEREQREKEMADKVKASLNV